MDEKKKKRSVSREAGEKAAKDAAELHRTLVEGADVGITLIDPHSIL